jgi:hypothetical protein
MQLGSRPRAVVVGTGQVRYDQNPAVITRILTDKGRLDDDFRIRSFGEDVYFGVPHIVAVAIYGCYMSAVTWPDANCRDED